MKRVFALAGAAVLALIAVSFPALAHHGGSEYDTKNPITLKGTVTEYYWANPHCQIYVDVKDDKGKTVNWAIETLAPAVMKRAGWNRELLHPGEHGHHHAGAQQERHAGGNGAQTGAAERSGTWSGANRRAAAAIEQSAREGERGNWYADTTGHRVRSDSGCDCHFTQCVSTGEQAGEG